MLNSRNTFLNQETITAVKGCSAEQELGQITEDKRRIPVSSNEIILMIILIGDIPKSLAKVVSGT